MKVSDLLRRMLSSELPSRSIKDIRSVGLYAVSPRIGVVGPDEASTEFFECILREVAVHNVLPRMLWEIERSGSSCVMVGQMCPDCGMDLTHHLGGPCLHRNLRFDRALLLSEPAVAFTGAGVFIRSLRQIRTLAGGDPALRETVDEIITSGGDIVEFWKDQPIKIDPDTVSIVGDPTYSRDTDRYGEADRRLLVEDWVKGICRWAAIVRGVPFDEEAIIVTWGNAARRCSPDAEHVHDV